MSCSLLALYQSLLSMYGHQTAWWPADSPFEVMMGAILTQNTQWSNVEKALSRLKQEVRLDPESLLELSYTALEMYLKPTGYFRVKTHRLQAYCHWYLAQGGYTGLQELTTQDLRVALLGVQGIGPETADDILLYAFARPSVVIDTYTRRLFERLGIINGHARYEDLQSLCESMLPKQVDLYQQLHALIVTHGKQRCRKTRPDCRTCVLVQCCAYSSFS